MAGMQEDYSGVCVMTVRPHHLCVLVCVCDDCVRPHHLCVLVCVCDDSVRPHHLCVLVCVCDDCVRPHYLLCPGIFLCPLQFQGQRYKGQDGRIAAADKIRGTFLMYLANRNYKVFLRKKWAVGELVSLCLSESRDSHIEIVVVETVI